MACFLSRIISTLRLIWRTLDEPLIPPKAPMPIIGGKLLTPHKQEHEQASPFCVPLPVATEGAAAEAAGGGGAAAALAAGEAAAAADEVAGGGGAAGEDAAGGTAPIAVPFCCMAMDRNMA